MRTMNVLPPTAGSNDIDYESMIRIDCCQLLWSYDFPIPSSTNCISYDSNIQMLVADITFVSDCIHFEEFHGELLWTLVTHTRKHAILCQPNRTPSLQNFLIFIQHVNESSTNEKNQYGPLLRMTEQEMDELQEKHDLFMKEQNDDHNAHKYYYYYDPDKHRPRIYVMDILRLPNEYDRQCMMQYCTRHHSSKLLK